MARPQKVRDLGPRLREVLHYFWPYTRPHRRLMTGSFLAIVAEVLLRLLEPWMLALVLDYVLVPQQGAAAPLPVLGSMDPLTLLLIASIGTVLTVGLRALAAYSSTVGFALIGNRVLTDVRADLYRHLHSLSLSYHNKARKGDLTVRVIGDIGLLKDVVVTAVLPLLGNLFVLVGMVTVLFWLNWQLALLSMVTVPALLAVDRADQREDPQGLQRPAPPRGQHGLQRLGGARGDADRAGPVAGAVVRGLLLRAQQEEPQAGRQGHPAGGPARAHRRPAHRRLDGASSCTSAPGWCSTATSRPAP